MVIVHEQIDTQALPPHQGVRDLNLNFSPRGVIPPVVPVCYTPSLHVEDGGLKETVPDISGIPYQVEGDLNLNPSSLNIISVVSPVCSDLEDRVPPLKSAEAGDVVINQCLSLVPVVSQEGLVAWSSHFKPSSP